MPNIEPVKQPTKQPPDPFDRWMRSKTLILLVQFLVTGILGLPLIWVSPAFNRTEKWFWSIVVSLYTLLLVAFAVGTVVWAITTINQITNG